jgi:hypothetical protein
MPGIPLPQRRRNGKQSPGRLLNCEARIHGTFRSPSGDFGTMTGGCAWGRSKQCPTGPVPAARPRSPASRAR